MSYGSDFGDLVHIYIENAQPTRMVCYAREEEGTPVHEEAEDFSSSADEEEGA